jgi:hypothetical protein
VCIFENTSSNATLDYGLRTEGTKEEGRREGEDEMEADLERRTEVWSPLAAGAVGIRSRSFGAR